MLTRNHLIIIGLFLALWQRTTQAQTTHTTSLFFTGTAYFNNNEEQRIGDYGITFQNPNTGLGAEFLYRRYGRQRLSVETGLRITTRNFKTIAYDLRDNDIPGRIGAGYPLSFSLPLRFFVGKPARLRTDLNQSGGVYAGALLQLSARRAGDARGVQYAIYREVAPRVLPHLIVGARRPGRLLDFNFELGAPLRGFRRTVDYAGQEASFRWWEVFFSIGIGHTF